MRSRGDVKVTQPVMPLPLFLDLSGRRVTLIGLGRRTHVSLARFLVSRGAIVRISDRKSVEQLSEELSLVADLPVDLRLGGHRDEDVADAEVVFVTPDASRELPVLEGARRRGIPISSEIELLFALCPAPIIGITGSAGKTTTTTLVGEMLRGGNRPVYVGGNIGVPLIDRIDDITPESWVVLELSSFQLENLRQSAQIGAVLNVTPNHLDRHSSFEQYRESKFNLIRYGQPGDVAILGADDVEAAGLASRCSSQIRWFSAHREIDVGAYRSGTALRLRDSVEGFICNVADLRVPGEHNVQNVLAAAAIARAANVDVGAIRQVATSFGGVEHRLEFVRNLGGVSYFNDSIATSPERAVAALLAMTRPVVLIAGGRSKHLPTDDLGRAIVNRARAVVTIGEMADEIESAIRAAGARDLPVERVNSIANAVRVASSLARPGDAVLLSPAGTSFDMFRDFEERGQRFKAAVHAMSVEGS